MSDLSVIGKQLKMLIRETCDNGIVLEKPKFAYVKDNKNVDRERLMIRLSSLLIDTTYFDRVTKMFISDYYISKTEVANETSRFGIDMCRSSVATRIRLDINKFVKDFGSSMLGDIIAGGNEPLDRYFVKLDELELLDNEDKCELDSLRGLMVPIGVECDTSSVSEERFDEFLDMLEPFTEVGLRRVEKGLDREMCWYVRQLLSKGALGEIEEQRLEKLRAVLGIGVKNF